MSSGISALIANLYRNLSQAAGPLRSLLLISAACFSLVIFPACSDSETGQLAGGTIADNDIVDGSDDDEGPIPNGNDVGSIIEIEGMQRVIVQLQPLANETNADRQTTQLNQRLKIIENRTAMLDRMVASNHRVTTLRTYETLPALVVEADQVGIEALRNDPSVATVIPDMQLELYLNQSGPQVGAPAAWSAGYEGAGWAVAVLDTGTDYNHPHFAGRLVAEACFSTTHAPSGATTLCPNGLDEQIGAGGGINCSGFGGCDHGTHVAGTAVGITNTVQGIARGGNVIPIQVFSALDDGSVTSFASDIIAALEHVLLLSETNPIAAVNMSLGGGNFTSNCDSLIPPATTAIQNLRAAGIATVVSSGNAGETNGIGFPACISSAIAVGAVSKSDVVASFSNAGSELEMLAPGTSIRSPVLNNTIGLKSGTSMAAPHVAGTFAVLRSVDATAEVGVLADTLKDTGVLIVDGRTGQAWPRIQVDAAVNALLADNEEPPVGSDEPILLSRSFDDNSLDGFTVQDRGSVAGPSQWSVENGVVRQSSNIYSGPTDRNTLSKAGTHLRYNDGFNFTDYRTTVDIQSSDNDAIGVIFRQQDDDNFYRFSWDLQRGYRRLVKSVNGEFLLLAEDSVPYVRAQSYELSISANGSDIEITIDGDTIFQVNDASLTRGTIAFYAWGNDNMSFDNLLVENLSTGVVTNSAPVIESISASPQSIVENSTSQLNIIASDADGDELTITWEVPAGTGSISDPNASNPVFTASSVSANTDVTLTAFVSDGTEAVSDQVTITVTDTVDGDTGGILLSDDFDDGDFDGWTAVDQSTLNGPAQWRVANGELQQNSNAHTSPTDRSTLAKLGTYLLRDDGVNWSDYNVQLDMSTSDNDALGVMFRVQDSNNYYRFSWDSQRGYRRIVKNSGGTFSLLAEDAFSYQRRTSYSIEISVVGNQIILLVDGAEIFNIVDNELATGSIALYSWGNLPSNFDNIVVTEQ